MPAESGEPFQGREVIQAIAFTVAVGTLLIQGSTLPTLIRFLDVADPDEDLQFLGYAVTRSGVFRDGWLGTITVGNYGDDFMVRSSANLVGIWANSASECIYFVGSRDGNGEALDGNRAYRIHFEPDAVPSAVVDGYWSIILVSLPDSGVIPNPDDRFNLNSYSPLVYGDDGSLDLTFSTKAPEGAGRANWLPTPVDRPFSLTFRAYIPPPVVRRGDWFPAPVAVID